ncbi:hypothetical protein BN3658_00775 [Coriobacteriaceae bacterium CHKCI002]|nr:hypothetical protein BN3658_00775 [Coriobacteriaceae bacterium CHKCI002]
MRARHADGVAGARGRIPGAVAAAQAVATGVQTLDGLVLLVQHVEVLVGHQAGHRHHGRRCRTASHTSLDAVERAFVDGDHGRRVLAEIGVGPSRAQLVVMSDGRKPRLLHVGGNLEVIGKILKGVGGDHRGVAALGDGAVLHLAALRARSDGGHAVEHVLVVLRTAAVGAAVLDARRAHALHPLLIGHQPRRSFCLTRARRLRAREVALVAEALAFAVEPQHGVRSPGAAQAAAENHAAARCRLHESSRPAAQLHRRTVAAAHEAVEVGLQAALALVALHVLVEQRPAHIRVAAVVAAGQDHALRGVDLHVLILLLDDHAGHVSVVVLHQHNGRAAVADGASQLHGLVEARLVDLRQHGVRRYAFDGLVIVLAHELHGSHPRLRSRRKRIVRLVEAVVDVGSGLDLVVIHVGLHEHPAVLRVVVGVAALVHAHLLGHLEHMVERRAGVLHIGAHDVGVVAPAAARDELVHDVAGVPRAEALIGDELGVEAAEVFAVPAHRTFDLLLDGHHLAVRVAAIGFGYRLACREERLRARVTQADDHHFGVNRLVGGHAGFLAQPVARTGVAEHAALGLGGLFCSRAINRARIAARAARTTCTACTAFRTARAALGRRAALGTARAGGRGRLGSAPEHASRSEHRHACRASFQEAAARQIRPAKRRLVHARFVVHESSYPLD